MTTATKTSDYYISIPITASYSVTLCDLPSGLSREEVLALLTAECMSEDGELVYPLKQREEVFEAVAAVARRSDEIVIDEDCNS